MSSTTGQDETKQPAVFRVNTAWVALGELLMV